MTGYVKVSLGGLGRLLLFWMVVALFMATFAGAQQPVVPNEPRNLTGANTNSGIELEWDAPTRVPGISALGPLRNYQVFRRTTEGSTFAIIKVVGVGTLTYVDNAVVKGVEYTYHVKAVNFIGPSAASNRVSVNATKYDVVMEMQDEVEALLARIEELESELAGNPLPGCLVTEAGTGDIDDVVFEGCNVHVRNGEDDTDTVNGVGNLIVGYNEDPDDSLFNDDYNGERTGSHTLVVGASHSWTGSSGIVSGYSNVLWADDGAIIGGQGNRVDGVGSVAVASTNSWVKGDYSAVLNSRGSEVRARFADVIGGKYNFVREDDTASVIAGGNRLATTRVYEFVSGN